MAHPYEVDIFSEDIDVNGPNIKPPIKSLFPNYRENPPPINTGRWNQWSTEIETKKKKIPKTKKASLKPATNPTPPKKSNWQPIPLVAGSSNTKPAVSNAPKSGQIVERPNLKVLDGSTIKINLDKPKGAAIEQEASTPVETKEEVRPESTMSAPEPSNHSPAENKPEPSGVRGRMTASSFMMSDSQPWNQKTPARQKNRNAAASISTTFVYPKGIPKSFLTQKHMQQLQPEHQQQNIPVVNPAPAKGPVWEVKIPSRLEHQIQYNTGQMYSQEQYAHNSQYTPSGQMYDATGQAYGRLDQVYGPNDQMYGASQMFNPEPQQPTVQGFGQPMLVQTEVNAPNSQYSPSDAYADMSVTDNNDEISESSESLSNAKRLSAFQRLGPVTQPKKPKLTINLLVGKDQEVREVVDESEGPEHYKYTPVPERADIQTSLDDTVMKFLTLWPWKKSLSGKKTVSARESKTVMQLELEQMEEQYEKDKMFFGIVVTGYPAAWNKEDVLDAVLEAVKGKSLIPCFIEFSKQECKFLVIRSKAALVAVHRLGFVCRKDDVLLNISIVQVNLSVNQIDFIPRLVLRKRLSMAMDSETEIDLKRFTLAHDVSHFLYFPLSRGFNQTELMQLQSSVPWALLTKLVLAENNITTLSGFDLPNRTPKLKHLDLSFNRIERTTALLAIRQLPLSELLLEGNPLCADHTDPARYVRVLRMMFPGLKEIDGIKLVVPGEFPPYRRNYAPPGAGALAARVLETLFPLLDAGPEERALAEDLYMDDAALSVTYMYKLRYRPIYKEHRNLFLRARVLDEGEMDSVVGAPAIAKLIHRWPTLEHDPTTFTVDVLYHTDSTTILRISGVMKVTAATLAEDEHLLHFTRTLVLHSLDSLEYKIANEMVYWDLPAPELTRDAFRMTTVQSKNINLKLDSPPDAELRESLLEIFMKLTDLDRKPSEKCLESQDWHLRNSLEYFTKLLKLDNLEPLYV